MSRLRYALAVMIVTVIVSDALTWAVALHAAQRAVQTERQARLDADTARLAQAQASLAVLCDLIRKQETVFRSFDTDNSRIAADAWHDLGVKYRCYKE